jgi:hypothetical protein
MSLLPLVLALLCAAPSAAAPASAAIKDDELEDGARPLMRQIHDDWMKKDYPALLRKHRLRMSCASCESIFLDVQLTIDGDGRVAEARVVKENRCGRAFSERMRRDFLRPLREIVFPEPLRGRVIETRLGTGLTC